MSDLENARAQRDARRTVAGRRHASGTTSPEQAILRHLGVEFYLEQHRTERPSEKTGEPGDEEPADGSADR